MNTIPILGRAAYAPTNVHQLLLLVKAPRSLAFALAALLLPLAACTKKSSVADAYFAAAMAERAPYSLPGISGYTIRAYEIVQTTGDMVAVKVTFAGKLGNDIVQTKKFALRDGRLHALEREDIHEGIRQNLRVLATGVDRMLLEGAKINEVTYAKLIASMENYTPRPVAGEDYSSLTVSHDARGNLELSVLDASANRVTLRAD